MNYGELKANIAAWLDRTDLTDKIPTFISLAEAKFFRVLRCPGNEQWVSYPSNPDNSAGVQIPNDFLECKVIMYGDRPLQRITDAAYVKMNASSPTKGTPKYFTRLKDYFYFYPEADYEDVVNLIYWESQGPMEDDADFTRTLVFAPDLYLYGALLEAQSYLIGDERLAVWSSKYGETLASIARSAADNEIGGSTMVVNGVYGD